MITTTVVTTKTKVRNSFSSFYEKAKSGSLVYISDRGKFGAAIVPITLLPKSKKPFSFLEFSSYGLFKNVSDPVAFVRGLRDERVKRQYGRKSSY